MNYRQNLKIDIWLHTVTGKKKGENKSKLKEKMGCKQLKARASHSALRESVQVRGWGKNRTLTKRTTTKEKTNVEGTRSFGGH